MTATPAKTPAIKANPFSLFETDAELERTGIELDYGPFYLRIARAGGANTKFRDTLRTKLSKYRRALETETMDEELADKLSIETFAETVVLGWGRTDTVDGKEVKIEGEMPWRDGSIRQFSVDNVKELFTLLPDFARDAMGQAQKVALFRKTLAEIDGKN